MRKYYLLISFVSLVFFSIISNSTEITEEEIRKESEISNLKLLTLETDIVQKKREAIEAKAKGDRKKFSDIRRDLDLLNIRRKKEEEKKSNFEKNLNFMKHLEQNQTNFAPILDDITELNNERQEIEHNTILSETLTVIHTPSNSIFAQTIPEKRKKKLAFFTPTLVGAFIAGLIFPIIGKVLITPNSEKLVDKYIMPHFKKIKFLKSSECLLREIILKAIIPSLYTALGFIGGGFIGYCLEQK